MKAFTTLTSHLCPLDMPNVDTDQIISKEFLKRVERTGFGKFLFDAWRKEDPNFVLNKDEYNTAKILLSRDNFGCGSSREHAPWALLDYGFECIIAPSFADIFYNNCFQNGILPIRLADSEVDALFQRAGDNAAGQYTVDLAAQKIAGEGFEAGFEIDDARKHKLLNGLDDIGWTLQFDDAISAHEKAHPVW